MPIYLSGQPDNLKGGEFMKMKLIKLAISLVVVGGVIFAITKFLPWKQIDFAVRHPVLVSGLQSAYNDEHQKADKNLLERQLVPLAPTVSPKE